ncbi:cysteine--tRNA ligase [Pseudoruegeria sp. SK021]|uniref:cysteine--tRNA ligase n=1 Tax=Pseudoruegeria sp. SK021 TaxID=1933035 RepID=UPI000A234F4E|nr:cysteine--tRNA ligase [Pseudoruegeria sp. SK021]OSP54275.1 cysteine--tRNA ligase [Pseudoruegeria sp. SK021]
MAEIRLYNTATRTQEALTPLQPGNVRMYVCGPTVYDRAHLGNARPVVVFDVLFRLLRQAYGADHVTYVRNFTDVDDKINAAALARKEAGVPAPLTDLIRERSDETIGWYHADMDALGALRPTKAPRATDYIAQMIALIDDLITRGHAYVAEGHVLFSVESDSAYGSLSGRSVDDMIAGARVEVAPYKRNPMDFVLWKPSSDDLPGWDSPWGRGRPGWHIECSAMARDLLGESFDIHGGGIDLTFPHHENEIAQSRCAHPDGEYAKIWMHNEMLQVEGKKMSKSLGNFFTVRDLLDQNIPGEVIRFVLLSTHYRKPMDWTEKKVADAVRTLDRWSEVFAACPDLLDEAPVALSGDAEVVTALSSDLNTAGALAALHGMIKRIDQIAVDDAGRTAELRVFLASVSLLGIDLASYAKRFLAGERFLSAEARLDDTEDWVRIKLRTLLEARAEARAAKDYARADFLRDAIISAGIVVKDTADGFDFELTDQYDPAKLEALTP